MQSKKIIVQLKREEFLELSKEINYPIKYAVLELKEKGGFLVGYENITQGFIVSKCYVMESNIVYNSDGSNEVTHKVVFPFKNILCLEVSIRNGKQNIGKENIPSYDANNRPYPVNIVTNLFDSYEEAKNIAEEKNEECRDNLILEVDMGNPNWKETFEIMKYEFDQRIELCNLFERLVLEATEDMEISELLSTDEQKSFVRILKPVKKQINE